MGQRGALAKLEKGSMSRFMVVKILDFHVATEEGGVGWIGRGGDLIMISTNKK